MNALRQIRLITSSTWLVPTIVRSHPVPSFNVCTTCVYVHH